MQKKAFILLLAIWSMVACNRQELPEGTLRISFETGALQTKALEGDGNAADGGGIAIDGENPDLVILIANSEGTIVAYYPNGTGKLEGSPLSTSVSISFTGLIGGNTYTVYAFGNTQGFWKMKSGGSDVTDLTALTTASQVEALQFQPQASSDLDSHDCLQVLEDRLPLSAKGTVTLESSGNGKIELPLLRCVAKVTARFENQFGEEITLYNFENTMRKMRPQVGYVVAHQNDYPVAPADASDLTSGENSLTIPNDSAYELSWYVFPSIGPYTCDVQFSQTDGGDLLQYLNLPIHDDHARDITKLDRNQHLTITTRISAGKKVSFNFEVSDWDKKTERITFN
ncbi:MAG: hypothetical protein E7125_04840 [Bacteroidales bacterium]|nr:hypothetical protein [Bacteroidales bacterium]